MDKAKLERYAELKNAIAKAEEELDELKPAILEAMEVEGAEQVVTEFGKFTIESKRTWKFSDHVEKAKAQIKEMEAEEKAVGSATYTENKFIKFYGTGQKD